MSTSLPLALNTHDAEIDTKSPLAFSDDEFDLVGMLLEQQQSLTAVEQFSHAAAAGELGSSCSMDASEPSQSIYYRRLMPATAPQPGQQLAFEVNLDTCSGCKACVVACMIAICLIGVEPVFAGLMLASFGSLVLLVAESPERLLYFMSIVCYRMPGTLK